MQKQRYRAKFGLWHGREFTNHDVRTSGVDDQAALRRAIRGVIRTRQPNADKRAVRDQLRGSLATIGRHYQIMKTESTRNILSEIARPPAHPAVQYLLQNRTGYKPNHDFEVLPDPSVEKVFLIFNHTTKEASIVYLPGCQSLGAGPSREHGDFEDIDDYAQAVRKYSRRR